MHIPVIPCRLAHSGLKTSSKKLKYTIPALKEIKMYHCKDACKISKVWKNVKTFYAHLEMTANWIPREAWHSLKITYFNAKKTPLLHCLLTYVAHSTVVLLQIYFTNRFHVTVRKFHKFCIGWKNRNFHLSYLK